MDPCGLCDPCVPIGGNAEQVDGVPRVVRTVAGVRYRHYRHAQVGAGRELGQPQHAWQTVPGQEVFKNH